MFDSYRSKKLRQVIKIVEPGLGFLFFSCFCSFALHGWRLKSYFPGVSGGGLWRGCHHRHRFWWFRHRWGTLYVILWSQIHLKYINEGGSESGKIFTYLWNRLLVDCHSALDLDFIQFEVLVPDEIDHLWYSNSRRFGSGSSGSRRKENDKNDFRYFLTLIFISNFANVFLLA